MRHVLEEAARAVQKQHRPLFCKSMSHTFSVFSYYRAHGGQSLVTYRLVLGFEREKLSLPKCYKRAPNPAPCSPRASSISKINNVTP